MQASLVYKFSCARCASEYVILTSRTLGARVAEHRGRSYRTYNVLANPPYSAVREHADKCNIPVNVDSFKILGTTEFKTDLRILESLWIFKTNPF